MSQPNPHINTAGACALAEAPLSAPVQVELVIPVYNEQQVLRHSVLRLYRYMKSEQRGLDFRITIVDNASSDRTPAIAGALARELPLVESVRLERKGRGLALRAAWSASDADVVAYMDVDLSTDLQCLPALIEPLLDGRADVAIGSRLADGAQVTRGIKREVISRSYNWLLRQLLDVGFSDAQCGFKAARRQAIGTLLSEIEDDRWFFDTELLYLAQRDGLVLHEVPVRWVDDPDSRVDIRATAIEDMRGIMRLRRARRASTAAPSARVAQRTQLAAEPGSAHPTLQAQPL